MKLIDMILPTKDIFEVPLPKRTNIDVIFPTIIDISLLTMKWTLPCPIIAHKETHRRPISHKDDHRRLHCPQRKSLTFYYPERNSPTYITWQVNHQCIIAHKVNHQLSITEKNNRHWIIHEVDHRCLHCPHYKSASCHYPLTKLNKEQNNIT